MEIVFTDSESMPLYESIPIAFTVKSIYEIEPVERGLGGISMKETVLERSYEKDYDQHERPSS